MPIAKQKAPPTPECKHCAHPQAKPREGEVHYIVGGVTQLTCAACSIHGRGTLGSPIHLHQCSLHANAQNMLDTLLEIAEDEDCCTCETRSWYGQGHDTACPISIAEQAVNLARGKDA